MNYQESRIVYSKSIANGLLDKGHQIIRLEQNNRDRSKMVFFFKDNETLEEDIQKLLAK